MLEGRQLDEGSTRFLLWLIPFRRAVWSPIILLYEQLVEEHENSCGNERDKNNPEVKHLIKPLPHYPRPVSRIKAQYVIVRQDGGMIGREAIFKPKLRCLKLSTRMSV
jgi:hypothetical protein